MSTILKASQYAVLCMLSILFFQSPIPLKAQGNESPFFSPSVELSALPMAVQSRLSSLETDLEAFLNAQFPGEEQLGYLPLSPAQIRLRCTNFKEDRVYAELHLLLRRPIFATPNLSILCQQSFRNISFSYIPSQAFRAHGAYPETDAELLFAAVRAYLLALWQQSFTEERVSYFHKVRDYANTLASLSAMGSGNELYLLLRDFSADSNLAVLWYLYHRKVLDYLCLSPEVAKEELGKLVDRIGETIKKTPLSVTAQRWVTLWRTAKAEELLNLCRGEQRLLLILKECFPTAYLRLRL